MGVLINGDRQPQQCKHPFAWTHLVFFSLLATGCLWLAAVPARASWPAPDDWRMVGDHDWSLVGLLADHNQHFSALPIAMYKALFHVIGFDPFWPYCLITIALHACVVLLVWAIMRRSGASDWMAALCAPALLLVQGETVVVSQFQMTLALTLALSVFVIAMKPSHWLCTATAAVLGMGAVASSGIAIPILTATFFVAWRRRDLVSALALTVPAALLYGAWLLSQAAQPVPTFRLPLTNWGPTAAWSVITGLAGLGLAGILLVAATAAGVAVGLLRGQQRFRWLEPGALVGSAALMLALVYLGRGYALPEGIGFGRFVYLAAAQTLPLIAVSATSLSLVRCGLSLTVLVPLALGLVVNVAGWRTFADFLAQRNADARTSLAALIASPSGAETPDWVQPYALTPFTGAGSVPWGFLRTLTPDTAGVTLIPVTAESANAATLRLRLAKVDPRPEPPAECLRGDDRIHMKLTPRQRITIPFVLDAAPITASLMVQGQSMPGPVLIYPQLEGVTVEVTGTSSLDVEFASNGQEFQVCT